MCGRGGSREPPEAAVVLSLEVPAAGTSMGHLLRPHSLKCSGGLKVRRIKSDQMAGSSQSIRMLLSWLTLEGGDVLCEVARQI